VAAAKDGLHSGARSWGFNWSLPEKVW